MSVRERHVWSAVCENVSPIVWLLVAGDQKGKDSALCIPPLRHPPPNVSVKTSWQGRLNLESDIRLI